MLELIKEMFTRYFSRDLQNWRVCFSKFCRDADRIGLFPFKTNVIPRHWVKAIWNSTFVPLRILISPYIFSGRSNWALEIRARKKRQWDVDKARGKIFAKKTPEGGHLRSLTLPVFNSLLSWVECYTVIYNSYQLEKKLYLESYLLSVFLKVQFGGFDLIFHIFSGERSI